MFEHDDKLITRSRAIVIDNVDPAKRGRIRVRHPLLGDTVWINYLKNPSFFDVPNIGDVVYLECDVGDAAHPVAHGNIVKGADGDLDIPEQFQRSNPTNRGFYTPGGHLIELDDGEGPLNTGAGVRITTSGGIKLHLLEDNPTTSQVLVEMPAGTTVAVDGIKDSITAETNFGDSMEISRANGIQLSTPALGGTSVSMKSGKIDIQAALDSTITAENGSLTIKAFSSEIDMTATGVAIKDAAGSGFKVDSGKVAMGGSAGEFIAIVEEVLKAFQQSAPQIAQTAVGPGVLDPGVVSAITQALIKIGLIKGSI